LDGLLEKAHQLRDREIVFDPDSGISQEDQKEILHEIEKVAARNRIDAAPEVFIGDALKRGVLFPLLVIAASLIALGVGAAGFYFLFQQGETRISRGQPVFITAEGKLIEEVRKEAEAKLQQKDREIGLIRDRLVEIDRQRQELQSTMEASVSRREKELQASLAAELEAERERLLGQGLSEEAVSRTLQDFQARKSAEAARQLDSFRAEAEAERRKAETGLKALSAEFATNLSMANEERERVLEESRKREQDIRGQLTLTGTPQPMTAQAEKTLTDMSTRKKREDLALAQLLGLYATARTDFTKRNFSGALRNLQGIRDFMDRPDIISLPGITRRRDFDLFVVASLSALAQDEIDKTKSDTVSVMAAAALLSDIRLKVGEADTLLHSGKLDAAAAAYGEALQVIPDITRSHGYLLQRDRDAEAARRALLRDRLAKAEAAFMAGKIAEAIDDYREAFLYLPESDERISRTVSSIASAGLAQGTEKSRQEQSQAASGLFSRANGFMAQGSPDDALPLYLQILSAYPMSRQSADAVSGIQSAVKGLNDRADERRKAVEAELGGRIASLRQELQARQSDIVRVKRSIADLLGQGGDPAAADLDALLGSMNVKYKDLVTRITSLQSLVQTNAQRLKDLQDRYKNYTALEDPILLKKGTNGLSETRPLLDSFLGSKPVSDIFPNLLSRIRRYDEGFQSAGRTGALQDAIDVVIDISQTKTPDERARLFAQRLKDYEKDPLMINLLKELQGAIR
jgi:hypothetical protein